MCGDNLAHWVRVDKASEEDEGNEMVVEDLRIEPKVCRDQSPGYEERDETEECTARLVAAATADFDDIDGAVASVSVCGRTENRVLRLDGIQDQNKSTLDHIPFVKGKVVYIVGNERIIRNANGLEHWLLPEASPSLYSCEGIDGNQDDDSFHRPRNQAESEGFRVIFVPGLYVESQER
jgi:hypothetical protein